MEIRGLGHIHLCGVLHVSWQTKDGADGQYLIALLYRDFLLLASAPRLDQVYVVQACIGLSDLRIEEIDNGRGMSKSPSGRSLLLYGWKSSAISLWIED